MRNIFCFYRSIVYYMYVFVFVSLFSFLWIRRCNGRHTNIKNVSIKYYIRCCLWVDKYIQMLYGKKMFSLHFFSGYWKLCEYSFIWLNPILCTVQQIILSVWSDIDGYQGYEGNRLTVQCVIIYLKMITMNAKK